MKSFIYRERKYKKKVNKHSNKNVKPTSTATNQTDRTRENLSVDKRALHADDKRKRPPRTKVNIKTIKFVQIGINH